MHGIVVRKRIEDRVEGFNAKVVDPLQRRRRRQQAEVVGAFRQQAVNERRIDAIGREYRVGDALRRVLIIIKTGGCRNARSRSATTEIQRQIARDRPGDVMGDSGCADAALCADDCDDPARRLLLPAPRTGRKSRRTTSRAFDRRNHIVADAAGVPVRDKA